MDELRFTPEEAREEAELIKGIASGDTKEDYDAAEYAVDKEKANDMSREGQMRQYQSGRIYFEPPQSYHRHWTISIGTENNKTADLFRSAGIEITRDFGGYLQTDTSASNPNDKRYYLCIELWNLSDKDDFSTVRELGRKIQQRMRELDE